VKKSSKNMGKLEPHGAARAIGSRYEHLARGSLLATGSREHREASGDGHTPSWKSWMKQGWEEDTGTRMH
jgi:transcription elongation factor